MKASEPAGSVNRRDSKSLGGDAATVDRAADIGQCPVFWTPPPEWAGLDTEQVARLVGRFYQRFRPYRRRWLAGGIDGFRAHLDQLVAAGADSARIEAAEQYLRDLVEVRAAARASDEAHAALLRSERARAADRRLRREGERR